MSTYKFLIVDESEKKNLLPQMKIDFSVKKIVRITDETEKIDTLPSVNWPEFLRDHVYLFQLLHDAVRTSQITLYFFVGDPQNSIWALKNPSTTAKFFEIDASDFLAHVDEVKKLAKFETTLYFVKHSYRKVEAFLVDAIADDLGEYLGVASDLSNLHNQTYKSKDEAYELERHCIARYEHAISQDWS